jgi:MFS transporter, DHA3 family, macrolide efflux protein
MEPLSETASAAPPLPRGRLWNRDFLLVWQGQSFSQLGTQAYSIAMMYWLMRATGSASLMGLMMLSSLLPGVILGPFGGTFADRHSRIKIALVCDLLSGVAVLTLAFAMFHPRVVALEPAAVRLVIGLMFGVSVLNGILRAFFTPAYTSVIPDLVPKERIPAANSLNQFSIQSATLIGQAVGGVLFQMLGAPLLYVADGVSYLYAALCASFVRIPVRERAPGAGRSFRAFLRETAEGFHYVRRQAGLRNFVLLASLVNFFAMPVLVLFPFYVEMFLKADARWYGFLMAGIGAGSVVGYVIAGTLRLKGEARFRGIFTAMVLFPACILVLGFMVKPFAALALVVVGGIALGIINVNLMSSLQLATPDEVRGRVMGLVLTLSAGLMPLGMAVGGVVGDLTNKNVPLVYAICGGCALLLTLVFGLQRNLHNFLANE